jgi:hypothetical protein
MKTIIFCAVFTAVAMLPSMNAHAQGAMTAGAGLDLLIPLGNFGNSYGVGFGGTAEFDYAASQNTSVTGKIGYLTWSGKNLAPGFSASYSGVPLLVGVRYYPHLFVTTKTEVKIYGHLEIGLMFGSTSTSGTFFGSSYSASASKTDITIVPSVGLEVPVSPTGSIDGSVRFFDIASKGSIGFRVGYRMAIPG